MGCNNPHCDCNKRPKCREECRDHHHYHHDQKGYASPHPAQPYKSVASLSGTTISTYSWSKNPVSNTSIAGIMIGCNAPAENIWPAIQSVMAGVSCLTEQVGASHAPQFDDVYQFRKYEGDAPCVHVLKPEPTTYVRSTVLPAPEENLPCLVRDCLGRAWTAVTHEFKCAETTETTDPEKGEMITYSFGLTYGDGVAVPDAKPFNLTIPAPPVPEPPCYPLLNPDARLPLTPAAGSGNTFNDENTGPVTYGDGTNNGTSSVVSMQTVYVIDVTGWATKPEHLNGILLVRFCGRSGIVRTSDNALDTRIQIIADQVGNGFLSNLSVSAGQNDSALSYIEAPVQLTNGMATVSVTTRFDGGIPSRGVIEDWYADNNVWALKIDPQAQ